jgi:hypothetical protein
MNEAAADEIPRIEVLVTKANKTVVLQLSSSDVRAIAVESDHRGQEPYSTALSILASTSKSSDREINWLATQHSTSQVFYAERLGQQITFNSVFATR